MYCKNCLNKDSCRLYPSRPSSWIIGAVELEIIQDNSVVNRVVYGLCRDLLELLGIEKHVANDIGYLTDTEVIERIRVPGVETTQLHINDMEHTKEIPEIYTDVIDAFLSAGESDD